MEEAAAQLASRRENISQTINLAMIPTRSATASGVRRIATYDLLGPNG
ncbi:MAG TPA: hypothetical protein VHZ53_01980 [Steroidobacteraceae bacterium]|jgi:hypothetical protein|nr:hypothetical protein [Steroidobacteraceae bacterium]